MDVIGWLVALYLIIMMLTLTVIALMLFNAKSIRANDMIEINGQKYWYMKRGGRTYLTNGVIELDVRK